MGFSQHTDTKKTKRTLIDRMRLVRSASLRNALEGAGVSEHVAKAVLYTLTLYTDERGVAFPGAERLARESGMSRKSASDALSALRRAGLIESLEDRALRTRKRRVRFDRFETDHAVPRATGPGAEREHDTRRAPPEHARGTTGRATKGAVKGEEKGTDNRDEVAGRAAAVSSLVGMGFGREEAERVSVVDAPLAVLGLLALGVDALVARDLYAERGDDAVLMQVRNTLAIGASQSKRLRSPAAYTVKAIRDGYDPSDALRSREERRKREAARRRADLERDAAREDEAREAERLREAGERALERVRAMPDDAYHDAVERWIATLTPLSASVARKRPPRASVMHAHLLLDWLDGGERVPS